ncbi:MAG: hypothetical protein M3Z00_02555 [Actinomycetota bacterium]|nr:hypothetical protein [Actinomycetota bacterium]
MPELSTAAATALALWGAAHSGGAAADDVLGAISGYGVTAGVRRDGPVPQGSPAAALPGPGEAPVGPAALLPVLRSSVPVLVLPRQGDVRGLPVAGESGSPVPPVVAAALRAGAAVVLPEAELTIVPVDTQWRVFTGAGTPAVVDPGVAREELDAAVGRVTRLFVGADLGREAADARQAVSVQVAARTVVPPPGTPGRAVSLLDRCVQLEAILAVSDPERTAAVNSYQLNLAAGAHRTLLEVAGQARRAAVAMAVRALLGSKMAGKSRLRAPGHFR